MEATPRITWLLPVRNAADYLLDALLSMQSQTFTDFEALVIDDGSSDGSLEIAMQLCKDDRRFILHRRAHSGLINTLNFGLAQVRTEFVARMDADDISMPDRLHIQLTYLDTHLNSVAAGSRVIAIDENGSHLYRSRKRVWRDSTYRNFPPNGIALCHPTVTFRTAGVRCAGGYRADFPAAEDYDLWLRLRAFGEIVELPECLLQYRVHSNSVSAQKAEQQLMSRIRAELVAFGRANNLPEDVLDRLTREADRHRLFLIAEKSHSALPTASSFELYYLALLLRSATYRADPSIARSVAWTVTLGLLRGVTATPRPRRPMLLGIAARELARWAVVNGLRRNKAAW